MTKARDLANAGTALTSVSATELGYLDGVTSAVQTQIDAKLATSTAASTYIPKTLTTTTGDIIYASGANTPARLGIGSTGNVLTVSGGVPAWSAPASALTLIHTETLSGVSAVNIDNKFTSTYVNYLILANIEQSTSNTHQLQYRSGGSTITSGYKGTYFYTEYTSNTWNVTSTTSDDDFYNVSSSTDRKFMSIYIADPQVSEFTKAQVLSTDTTYNVGWNSIYPQTTSIDGIRMSCNTGTMTGTIRIYGYQNS